MRPRTSVIVRVTTTRVQSSIWEVEAVVVLVVLEAGEGKSER